MINNKRKYNIIIIIIIIIIAIVIIIIIVSNMLLTVFSLVYSIRSFRNALENRRVDKSCLILQSVVMVLFRDSRAVGDELEAWKIWHSRQQSYKQRILDIGLNPISSSRASSSSNSKCGPLHTCTPTV